jgi:hypothetical protein
MRPKPQQAGAVEATTNENPQPAHRYLTNDEAAAYLRLAPSTLEKHRVIGGGPRFHKLGRRVVYTHKDLEAWANARTFGATFDPEYAAHRAALAARGR